MKNTIFVSSLMLIFFTLLSGCAAAGGIFKAGVGFGVFIVIAIVAVVLYFVSKTGNNK